MDSEQTISYEVEAFYTDGHSSIVDQGDGAIGEARARARAAYSDSDVMSVRVLVDGGEVWGNTRS